MVSFMSLVDNEDPDELYELIDEVAVGSYGSVYKARHLPTDSIVAMKIMEPDEDEELDDFAAEIAVLKDCAHPNIVNFVGAYKKGDEIFISMEFCDGGAANDIFKLEESPLKEDEIRSIARESLIALDYLHQLRIVHRDIKAANILLNTSGTVKLADFGVASLLKDKPEGAYTFIGTPYWMAPEVIDNKSAAINPYDMKSDVWSMGVTCIELAQITPPLSDVHPMRALFRIPIEDPPKLKEPGKWTGTFTEFLACCMVKDPKKRSSSADLLQHAWLNLTEDDSKKHVQGLVKRLYNLKGIAIPVNSDDEGDEPTAEAVIASVAAADSAPAAGDAKPPPDQAPGLAAGAAVPDRLRESGAFDSGDSDAVSRRDSDMPDFTVSDDEELKDVPTAQDVLAATIRKPTLARANRPQKALTEGDAVQLANQIRARGLVKKQFKEISKLKKKHDEAEKALVAQLDTARNELTSSFAAKLRASENQREQRVSQLQSQLKKELDKHDKEHDKALKALEKTHAKAFKEFRKQQDSYVKSRMKETASAIKNEVKQREAALKAAGRKPDKAEKQSIANMQKQMEQDTQHKTALERAQKESALLRAQLQETNTAIYEHLNSAVNMELEAHDQQQTAATDQLEASISVLRDQFEARLPLEIKATEQVNLRQLEALEEMHAMEADHLTKVIEEEARFQHKTLVEKIKREMKKYKKKQARERKKHSHMAKKEWKALCAKSDAAKQAEMKERKAKFMRDMDEDKKQQVDLQKRSQEHQQAQVKAKLDDALRTAREQFGVRRAGLEIELQQKRIDLLIEQQAETTALVKAMFERKRDCKTKLHQKLKDQLKESHAQLSELLKKQQAEAAALVESGSEQSGRLAERQADQRSKLESQYEEERDNLDRAGREDAASITAAFQRLAETIAKNQRDALNKLENQLRQLGGEPKPRTGSGSLGRQGAPKPSAGAKSRLSSLAGESSKGRSSTLK